MCTRYICSCNTESFVATTCEKTYGILSVSRTFFSLLLRIFAHTRHFSPKECLIVSVATVLLDLPVNCFKINTTLAGGGASRPFLRVSDRASINHYKQQFGLQDHLKTSHVDAFRNEMAKNPIEIEAHFYEANEISYPG